MYRAKSQHDSDYAFYDDALDREALERFKRIAELRRAIDETQFTLAYQPVVSLEPLGKQAGDAAAVPLPASVYGPGDPFGL